MFLQPKFVTYNDTPIAHHPTQPSPDVRTRFHNNPDCRLRRYKTPRRYYQVRRCRVHRSTGLRFRYRNRRSICNRYSPGHRSRKHRLALGSCRWARHRRAESRGNQTAARWCRLTYRNPRRSGCVFLHFRWRSRRSRRMYPCHSPPGAVVPWDTTYIYSAPRFRRRSSRPDIPWQIPHRHTSNR